MIDLYVSPAIRPYTLEAGYGLFFDAPGSYATHPLSLSSLPVPVHLGKSRPNKKKGIGIYFYDPAPPEGLRCQVWQSQTPQRLPDAFFDYLRTNGVQWRSRKSDKRDRTQFSFFPIGYGEEVAELFSEEQFHPFGDLHLEYVELVILPYAEAVRELVRRRATEWLVSGMVDLAVSYIYLDLLPHLYSRFP